MSAEQKAQSIDGCDTVAALFADRVNRWGDRVALREKDFGIWNEYTWKDWGEMARAVGLGLKSLGMQRGDRCSIASEVCREWLFADLGVIGIGGVTNGVYPTDSPSQVEYLIADSGTRFYFAEDEEQLDKVLEVRSRLPDLVKIIVFDMEGLRSFQDSQVLSFDELITLGRNWDAEHPHDWDQGITATRPEDLLVLTYTSGTTGPPKGAMISHRNMIFMMRNLQDIYGMRQDDEQLGFLPLAHVAGRMFYTSAAIESGCVVNLVEDMETFQQDQQEIAPSVHFAVPRVWEKQFSQVTIRMKDATRLGQWAYAQAIGIGQRRAAFRMRGEQAPLGVELLFRIADVLVLRNIRIMLGINDCRWLSTAAAPIASDLIAWFWALGKEMYEVYGQTECTGLATANWPGNARIGSVGKACIECDVVLSPQKEILIRGPGVIPGYWNKPEKTADTIIDGWLHTGDVGRVDEAGFIYIVDRMKDIIITAGGKNITPSEIENQLKFSPFISDAVVIGDRRPYLTCLVMIDLDNVSKYAQDMNVVFTNYTSLCHTKEVQDLIGAEIEKVNAKFARVETIKRFALIDQLLDAEDEELTPTMKLKRKVVNEKYKDMIAAMYAGEKK
ncbi:MAG: long-chain fatty acid--CoA ligase [Gammaproteobacteria bacterium]|nr:long-chain fatty acid--CoA ligase [Gammaproteobacteria bacterium]